MTFANSTAHIGAVSFGGLRFFVHFRFFVFFYSFVLHNSVNSKLIH